MPYGTTSKYFSSDTPGAPAIFADAGGLVGWLDAVLVTGYGAAVISQIVVTDGVAVATTNLGHSLRKWMVALHEKTGHAGLDGEHRVIGAAGASYTFEVTGVPNGTYTGGSVKVAPLGFEISYSATNRRIYRSKDTERRNAVSLFVDDTNTVSGWNIGTNKALAQVKMVCDVVSIDNYVTLDTTWWPKSAATSGTLARPWLVAGDALGFYSAVDVASTGYAVASSHFMQLNTLAQGDQFATMLEGATPSTQAPALYMNGLGSAGACMSGILEGRRTVARALSQVGPPQPMHYVGLGCLRDSNGWTTSGKRIGSSGSNAFFGFSAVNPADSGVILGQTVIAAHSPTGATGGSDFLARAVLPGLFSVPCDGTWSMSLSVMESPGGAIGSNLLALPAQGGGSGPSATATPGVSNLGGYYVDITKDWR